METFEAWDVIRLHKIDPAQHFTFHMFQNDTTSKRRHKICYEKHLLRSFLEIYR